jgi:predicted nucleotidyltransferase component of viral defense system
MDQNNPYFKQAQMLVKLLPAVSTENCFALKGGTAINLFIRDLPRLSVDIDLTYLPIEDRLASLNGIHTGMLNLKQKIEAQGYTVATSHISGGKEITRLIVDNGQSKIKIEVSPVLRGTVHPPEKRTVCSVVEAQFGFAEMDLLSFEDLFAGKICAALDRQHPRDLYDVKCLLENEGLTTALKNTFLVYLISHHRPIAELLNPNRQNIEEIYKAEFEDMTSEVVTLDQLKQARENLIESIKENISERDKSFLLGLKQAQPDWESFYYPEAQKLPAVKWKLHNIRQMKPQQHRQAVEKLEAVLYAT